MTTVLECDLKHHSLQLLREYQQTGKARLRNQLVELNLGLVRKEARYWTSQCQETYDDLLQVGSIGLLSAIDKFDIEKGYAFSTFAMPYIRGEIQHYLRDKSSALKMPRRWFTLVQQSIGITKDLQAKHQRPPTEAETAQALDQIGRAHV